MPEQRSNVVPLNTLSSSALLFEIETLFSNLLNQHITPQLEPALDALIKYTAQKLESATNNTDLMLFMEVEQKLKRNKSQLIENYSSLLANEFSLWSDISSATSEDISDTTTANDLSLIDNTILEQKLAWQAAARQMEMCEQLQNLYNCESRLENLTSTDPERIPIGSIVLCEGFANTLAPLNIDLEITQELLSQFARHLKSAVAKIWERADEELSAMGLELTAPKISTYTETPDHSSSAHLSNSTNVSSDETGALDQTMVDAIARQVVTKVENLLGHSSGNLANGEDSTPSLSSACFATSDLTLTLTSIQSELSGQHSIICNLTESIKNALLSRGLNQNLSPRQEDMIDMVGLLFEYIIDDHELPETVKNLIGLLQIPVLKLALIEKEFLSDRNHPGRQLLNDMTSAGMHCKDSDDPVVHLIKKTVKNILHSFIDNPNIFSDCLNVFNNSLIMIQRNELQSIEIDEWDFDKDELEDSYTDLPLETDSISQQADEKPSPVDETIAFYCEHYNIPDSISELVSTGWKKVLQFSHDQNHSEDQWFHRVNTLEMLLWNIQENHQTETNENDWLVLKNNIIDLFSEVELSPFVVAEWLHSINKMTNNLIDLEEEIIIEKNEQPSNEQIYTPMTDIEPENSDTETEPPDFNSELCENITIPNLSVGQWVEFIGKNDRRLQCKLSTINHRSDRYLFINKSGMKVAEWSGVELKKAIKNQKIVILDNHQFFDRALQAVMGNFLKF